ncbi:MAG: enoyl-[acyl-carrier-protein] reductase FabL [Chloroflexi bacterium]|nr:enoyl-[acyl-carrier-protein] reductase FabL [Chloroflexota bacterium]
MVFKGRVALVTGGGRGIGRAIVLELARNGADVAVNYLRNVDAAEQTAEEARALGVRTVALRGHVGDPEKIERLFGQVAEQFGRLDILVNNAASGVNRRPLELEPRHWDWTMNINARGPLLCARHAVPLMAEGGAIVNLSSLGSTRVIEDYLTVGVSKAALEALTRYLAVELAPRGIRVNAVSGGVVDTDALKHFEQGDQMRSRSLARTPAGRLVEPEDIARVVAFLCSPAAAMIVGQTVVVDGGYALIA